MITWQPRRAGSALLVATLAVTHVACEERGATAPAPASPPATTAQTQTPTADASHPSRITSYGGEPQRAIVLARPRFQACRTRTTIPSGPGGKLELVAHIDRNGSVTALDEKHDGSLPPPLVRCLASVVKSLTFGSAPNPYDLSLPFTFIATDSGTPAPE